MRDGEIHIHTVRREGLSSPPWSSAENWTRDATRSCLRRRWCDATRRSTSARPESIDNTWYIRIISERDELCENFPHVLSECIPSGEKFLHKLCEYERQTGPVSTRSRDRPRNLERAWFFAILLSRSCHCLGIVTYTSCFRRADESLTSGSIQVCE